MLDLLGVAHGVVQNIGDDGRADGEQGGEKERESRRSAGDSGRRAFKAGRAESDRRMELFWKLELMPASLILRTSSS